MTVHDRCQVAPLVLDFEVSHIAYPDLVGTLHVDLVRFAVDAIEELAESRHAPIELGRTGPNAVLAHQALDAPPADRFPIGFQGRVHARAAVGFPAVAMDRLNLDQQARILAYPFTGRPLSPGVVARRADAIKAAHRSHRERFLAVLDEGKHVPFRAEVNAMAFFNRSCSSFRRS